MRFNKTYRIAMLIAAAVMMMPVCPHARAEAPEASAEAPILSGAVLEIASSFVCDGMDRPYSEGYMPHVEDGTAHIVLPLRPADPENAPSVLNVRIDLGETSAPFVFENYDMRIPLTEEPAGSGDMLYLVSVTLPLVDNAEGGRYPVSFTCSGRYGGSGFSETFTVYVTVPGDTVPEAPEPGEDPGDVVPVEPDSVYDPEAGAEYTGGGGEGGGYEGGGGGTGGAAPEPTAAPQPKLMIVSQSVSPSPVLAGEGFTLSVSIRNTSANVPASNLLITVEGDGSDVYAADGEGSAYFSRVKAGEVFSVTVPMASSPEASPGPKKVTLHAGYDGPQGTGYTQDESVTVQVTQPVRFAVDEPEVPSSLPAGETWSVPVNVMNLGRAAIRNVSASIEAPGIRTQTTLFLGNLESGSARKGTLYAYVGPKSDDADKARYGGTEGILKVSCEDEYGNEHINELPFKTDIEAPVIRSTKTEEPEQEEEPAFQWQASVIAGAAIAAAAAGALVYRRKREKKSFEDE